MKCPKCGYTSFDDNQVCPRCNKDISAERARLRLPDYRSNPPFLLGALTGQIDESDIEIQMDYPVGMEVDEQQEDMGLVSSIETAADESILEAAEKITVVIDKKKRRMWADA